MLSYITPEFSSKFPRKSAPQPQLKHARAGSYSPHQALPQHSKPTHDPFPCSRVGARAGAAFPRASARLPPDSPLQAHVCCCSHHPPRPTAFLLLHQPPCADSHLFLVLCLSFLSISFAQSLTQEIKDNPPFFFAAGFPV